MAAQFPVVVGVVLLHRAQHRAVARIKRRQRQVPAAKTRLQIAQIPGGCLGRPDRIFALIDPVIDAQPIDASALRQKLPQPDCAFVRLVVRVIAALDHRDVQQKARQVVAVQRLLDQGLIATLPTQPRADDGAPALLFFVKFQVLDDVGFKAHKRRGQTQVVQQPQRRQPWNAGTRRRHPFSTVKRTVQALRYRVWAQATTGKATAASALTRHEQRRLTTFTGLAQLLTQARARKRVLLKRAELAQLCRLTR